MTFTHICHNFCQICSLTPRPVFGESVAHGDAAWCKKDDYRCLSSGESTFKKKHAKLIFFFIKQRTSFKNVHLKISEHKTVFHELMTMMM